MSRLNIALLAEEAAPGAGDPAAPEEAQILQEELAVAETEQVASDVEQAGSDINTLETIASVAESSPDQPLSDGESALVNEAMESICHRYGMGVPKSLSIESLSSTSHARRDVARQARQIQDRLIRHRQVATEGFLDRMAFTLKETFTTLESMDRSFEEACDALQKNGSRSPDVSLSGAFTHVLNTSGSGKMTPEIAVKSIQEVDKVVKSAKILELIDELIKNAGRVKGNIRKNWFFASSEDVVEFKQLRARSSKIRSDVSAMLEAVAEGEEVLASPIQPNQLKPIISARDQLRNRSDLGLALKKLEAAHISATAFLVLNTFVRAGGIAAMASGFAAPAAALVGGLTAGDLRNGYLVQSTVVQIFNDLQSLITQRNRMLMAIGQYVKKSAA